MFERKGVILIEKTDGVDEDVLMEAALDAGAEDFKVDDDVFEILTSTTDFHAVADALREGGYELFEADIEQVASIESAPGENEVRSLAKLIDMLEENDDVQKVYTNSSVPIEAE
jgi:transcriptional/translational regulatory protein YebC/TACO1